MTDEIQIRDTLHVKSVLNAITFAPSCVDMYWSWEVEDVFVVRDGNDRSTQAAMTQVAYRLRTTFRRPDRDTGEAAIGYGRWWEVPKDTTVSGVVKTAFAAAKMILEHELMESFKWNGVRVFDPHNNVLDLAQINQRKG